MLAYRTVDDHRIIATGDFVAQFVDVPRFLELCRACPMHGKTWACPEFDFDVMEIWDAQPWLHLFARAITFPEGQPRSGLDPDRLKDDVMRLFAREKGRLRHRLLALRRANPGAVPLLAGACDVCPECTRTQGLPCARPKLMFHSIESLGGDVGAVLADLFGIRVEWSDGTSLPSAFHLVVGILTGDHELAEPLRGKRFGCC